jgi:hypothetical protein
MYDIDIWKIISQFIHRKKDRQNARSAFRAEFISSQKRYQSVRAM